MKGPLWSPKHPSDEVFAFSDDGFFTEDSIRAQTPSLSHQSAIFKPSWHNSPQPCRAWQTLIKHIALLSVFSPPPHVLSYQQFQPPCRAPWRMSYQYFCHPPVLLARGTPTRLHPKARPSPGEDFHHTLASCTIGPPFG